MASALRAVVRVENNVKRIRNKLFLINSFAVSTWVHSFTFIFRTSMCERNFCKYICITAYDEGIHYLCRHAYLHIHNAHMYTRIHMYVLPKDHLSVIMRSLQNQIMRRGLWALSNEAVVLLPHWFRHRFAFGGCKSTIRHPHDDIAWGYRTVNDSVIEPVCYLQ